MLLIALSINSYAQFNIQSAKSFELSGTLLNRDTGKIILWYPDTTGKYIRDTAYVNNGLFSFKGYISEPSFAHLIGSEANGNRTNFFLEEGDQTVILKENSFGEMEMKGSRSQILYESLNDELANVEKQSDAIDSAIAVLDSVITHLTDSKLKRSRQHTLAELQSQRKKLFDSTINTKVNFIKDHSTSYVSVLILNGLLIVSRHPVYAVKSLYNLLDPKLKSSRAGLYCLSEIEKRVKLTSGNFLSNFQANSIQGKTITLNQFKNKYVLLDFWASWCVPCREEIPKIQRAYTQFRSKGLKIIAVSLDDAQRDWEKAVQKDRTNNWVHVLKNKEMALIFEPIQVIPQKILLDKAGKIIWSSLDETTNDWQEVLANQLKTDSK